MSFIIALYVGEGMVFASDSRTTYQTTSTDADGKKTTEHGVHITDSTYKTFITPANIAISTCGDASINDKPIAGYIESFISEHRNDNVIDVKDAILPYFKNLSADLSTTFFVGGYLFNENGTYCQKLYRITTNCDKIEERDTNNQGAIWGGETDVMSRIITTLYIKDADKYVEHAEYPILWNFFTLQDAVDFAQYAVKTTIDTMRFQKRVKTVGGPIDILVLKPDGAQWISRKGLHG